MQTGTPDIPPPSQGKSIYSVIRLTAPAKGPNWADELWVDNTLEVSHFHPQGSSHRPDVRACVAVSNWGLHLAFRVKQDRAVVCRHRKPNGPVCRDSCVELFLEPPAVEPTNPPAGYFNFEANCGATLHASWVTQPVHRGQPDWCRLLTLEQLGAIAVHSSIADRVSEQEIPGPLDWSLSMHIPLDLIGAYTSPNLHFDGPWRANLYKCADDSTLPHWASWSPIGNPLDFHQPAHFGTLIMPG